MAADVNKTVDVIETTERLQVELVELKLLEPLRGSPQYERMLAIEKELIDREQSLRANA